MMLMRSLLLICDTNGVLDECELESGDCNANGVLDSVKMQQTATPTVYRMNANLNQATVMPTVCSIPVKILDLPN